MKARFIDKLRMTKSVVKSEFFLFRYVMFFNYHKKNLINKT